MAGWDWWLNPQQDLKENGHAPAPEDVIAVEAVMRKIIESTLVSVDGVIGDPQAWAMDYRDKEVQQDALERLSGTDALLMGRRTYEVYPLLVGRGKLLFREGGKTALKLVAAKTLGTGVVVLSYQPAET